MQAYRYILQMRYYGKGKWQLVATGNNRAALQAVAKDMLPYGKVRVISAPKAK